MGRRAKGTGTLKKTPGGRWKARLRIVGRPGSKPTFEYRTFDTKREGDAWLAEQSGKQKTKLTFGQVATAWLADQKKRVERDELAPSTFAQYKLMVDLHLVPELGERNISSITSEDVSRALRAVPVGDDDIIGRADAMEADRPYRRAGSVPKRRAVLFSIFSAAVANNIVAVNPVGRAIEKTRSNREKRPQVGLTEAQFAALLDAARGTPGEAYIRLALATGARPSELLALTWRDIDFEANRVSLFASLGQIEVDGPLVRKATKTEASIRIVPVKSTVLDPLRDRIGEPDAFVFATSTGKPLNLRNVATRWVAPLGKKIGVARLTPYTLRHAVATMFARRGVSDVVAASMLGHSGTRMLKAVYQHAESDLQREAAQRLGELF